GVLKSPVRACEPRLGTGELRCAGSHEFLSCHTITSLGIGAVLHVPVRGFPLGLKPAAGSTQPRVLGRPHERAEPGEGVARVFEDAGDLVLLSQDEARFPMVPALGPTPGVNGYFPTVGTRDCEDLLYAIAVVDTVTAAVHSNLLESPTGAKQ